MYTKVDLRIQSEHGMMGCKGYSKDYNDLPESCKYFQRSKFTKDCMYLSFNEFCTKLIVDEKEIN
jgi:hypothetical protein